MTSRLIEEEVAADFARARRGALIAAVRAVLVRRPNTLIPYHEVSRHLRPFGASERGLQVVSIAQIVGSTDRAHDFDPSFRPRGAHTAARWKQVARAVAAGVPMPPVRLTQLGETYFVVDGHHRISVARARGQQFIDAVVVAERVRTPDEVAAPAKPSARVNCWPATPGISCDCHCCAPLAV